jgi:hypothetical protein
LLVTDYHHVPGRLRVRLRKGDGDAEAVAARLRETPGIASATVRAATGSLVLHYDPAVLDPAEIWALLPVETPHATRAAAPPDAAGTPSWLEGVASAVADSLAKALLDAAVRQIAGRSAAALIGALV